MNWLVSQVRLSSSGVIRMVSAPLCVLTIVLFSSMAWAVEGGLSVSGEGAYDERASEHRVKATLHVLRSEADRVRLGVYFEPDEHWHVYWKNSGDAGLSTQIKWKLSTENGKQWSSTEMTWPVPEVFVQGNGAITTYGYGSVLHEVDVPEAFWASVLSSKEALKVEADLNYLTCKVECIPGMHSLSLDVQPADVVVADDGDVLELFNEYAGRVPVSPSDAPHVSVQKQRSADVLAVGSEGTWRVRVQLCEPGDKACAVKFHEVEQPAHIMIPELAEGLKVNVQDVVLDRNTGEAVVDIAWRTTATQTSSDDVEMSAVLRLEDASTRAPRGVLLSERFEGGIKPRGTLIDSIELASLGGTTGKAVNAQEKSGAEDVQSGEDEAPLSILYVLWLAFVGGLILNVMPCVFPVISIKIASVAQIAHHERGAMVRHGLAYGAGILVAMLALALGVVALRIAGIEAGWGFQFQSPLFLLILICALTLFAVNLFGVFELGTPLGGKMHETLGEERSPLRQSFLEGLLCVALATPCSAPFMGTAVGFALASSGVVIVAVFVMLGLGLAAPFVVLCALPGWSKYLPKPGPWLLSLKYVLGWCILLTCVWLLWLLGQGQGANGMALALLLMCVLAAVGGIYGKVQYRSGGKWSVIKVLLLAAVISSVFVVHAQMGEVTSDKQVVVAEEGARWNVYDENAIRADVDAGKVVFVDFTAEWCITCKVNENGVLESEAVLAAAREHDVVWYKADWTHRDDRIRAILKSYGKGGVPMYLIFSQKNRERGLLLPELLTEDGVIDALNEAR